MTAVAAASPPPPGGPRFTVRLPSIDPVVPAVCVSCLDTTITRHRRLVYRRSDGAVERVAALHWPYCDRCYATLARLDRAQRSMFWLGFGQMAIVVYAVGASMAYYDMWWWSLFGLAVLFVAFVRVARRARALWDLEAARIDDVYKGALGAAYSFKNRDYAQRFLDANGGAAAVSGVLPISDAGGDAGATRSTAPTAAG